MDDTARALILQAAKANAPDYYLSALLAPSAARDDLLALAAFEGEIDRIAREVSEPMVAEIRLQWWRDWIAAMQPGTSSGNPLADALADVVARHGLDKEHLVASIDARSTLEEGTMPFPMPGGRARQKARDCAAMQRAATVLGVANGADEQAGLEAAGLALSFARLALKKRARLGQTTGVVLGLKGELQQARHNLLLVRSEVPRWTKPLRLAALPVALVEPYLHACEKGGAKSPIGEATRLEDAILPLTRVWRLWRFARFGRM